MKGRSVLRYEGAGRRFVLKLKHGDRPDLARAAAGWMARQGASCLTQDPLLVPVPIHWSRRVARRYNQSAELARWLSRVTGHACASDALSRSRATGTQDGKTVAERFANVEDVIGVGRRAQMKDRHVCLIDDVMTSGATLSACARTVLGAGATRVSVLTLARVVKRP